MRLRASTLPAGLLAPIGGLTLLAGQASAVSCARMNPQQSPAQRAAARGHNGTPGLAPESRSRS